MSQNQHQAAHQRQTQVGVNPDDTVSFVNLPLELRRKIWKHAAVSQPRVIQLKICEATNTCNLSASDIQYQIPKENLPEVLLKACFESQDIVKENYKYTKFLGSPLCYDPDIDVLWVRGMVIFLVNQDLELGTIGGYAGALFEQKEHPLGRPYLFRSVALEFAGIKKSHKDYATSAHNQGTRDFRLAIIYGISRTEVEKIYIVYSSGDTRDEVDREVEDFIDKLNILCRPGSRHPWIRQHLKEKNKRDGTNLKEWTPPSVEAILDTELMSGANDRNWRLLSR